MQMFHSLNNCLAFWNHHPVWQDLLIKQTNFSLQKNYVYPNRSSIGINDNSVVYGCRYTEQRRNLNSELKPSHYPALVKVFTQSQSVSLVLNERG